MNTELLRLSALGDPEKKRSTGLSLRSSALLFSAASSASLFAKDRLSSSTPQKKDAALTPVGELSSAIQIRLPCCTNNQVLASSLCPERNNLGPFSREKVPGHVLQQQAVRRGESVPATRTHQSLVEGRGRGETEERGCLDELDEKKALPVPDKLRCSYASSVGSKKKSRACDELSSADGPGEHSPQVADMTKERTGDVRAGDKKGNDGEREEGGGFGESWRSQSGRFSTTRDNKEDEEGKKSQSVSLVSYQSSASLLSSYSTKEEGEGAGGEEIGGGSWTRWKDSDESRRPARKSSLSLFSFLSREESKGNLALEGERGEGEQEEERRGSEKVDRALMDGEMEVKRKIEEGEEKDSAVGRKRDNPAKTREEEEEDLRGLSSDLQAQQRHQSPPPLVGSASPSVGASCTSLRTLPRCPPPSSSPPVEEYSSLRSFHVLTFFSCRAWGTFGTGVTRRRPEEREGERTLQRKEATVSLSDPSLVGACLFLSSAQRTARILPSKYEQLNNCLQTWRRVPVCRYLCGSTPARTRSQSGRVPYVMQRPLHRGQSE